MVGAGSLLGDRYQLEEKLATGGMGSVYRATDLKLGRSVALKLLAANLAEDATFVERFRREARAAAGLRHPKIANVFDAGEADDSHFIVMELAEGRDLARLLREEGPLSEDRAVNIVDQICLALGHAHAAGIIHRDIKPANIIVGDDDSVKVTDFGIARAADESKLTVTGSVLGTAHYISPEQAEGKPLTATSDIYALGIVMFETLTGAVPFTGESLMSVALRHINDQVPPPSTIDPGISNEMDEIVARATRKAPSERYGDASEMHEALSSPRRTSDAPTAVLAAGSGTDQMSTVWPIPGDRWDPHSLGRKVLAVFGVLALIALALAGWRLASFEPPTEQRSPGNRDAAAQNLTLPEGVIGMDHEEVQQELAANGFESRLVFVEGDELERFMEDTGIDPEQAEEKEVIGTDPSPGESLQEDQTITLFVSSGFDDDDDGPDFKGKGKGKGHDKKEDDD